MNRRAVVALSEYGVFLFSTVCHEAAHAFAALKLGDPTAARGGQAGIDPLPHIKREPVGMVLVPILGLVSGGHVIGWASTPYDPDWAARHPRREAWMSFAGPGANLLLAILAGLAIHAGIWAGVFIEPLGDVVSMAVWPVREGWTAPAFLLSIVFTLNVVLFIFNLLPLPPLDGAAVIRLTPGGGPIADRLRRPPFNLLGLLLAWQVFPYLIRPIRVLALNLLYPGSGYQ